MAEFALSTCAHIPNHEPERSLVLRWATRWTHQVMFVTPSTGDVLHSATL
jgi:hypothetical protein